MSLRTARLTACLLLLGLPLAAGWLSGFPPGFAEMPPQTIYIHPPGFSPAAYALLAVLLVAAAAFFTAPQLFGFTGPGPSDLGPFDWSLIPDPGQRFPTWGWAGLGLLGAGWTVAWTHPASLGRAADHSFVPLWLGYVLTVDALAYRRAGVSPLARSKRAWLAWFPVSAAVWWYFELLNRFVQNWIYLGVGDFSAFRYILGSTLAYSTVIPAVLTTAAFLSTFDHFRLRFARHPPRSVTASLSRRACWGMVGSGAAGLVLIPWYPLLLFPLLWVAPLLIVSGLLERAGLPSGAGNLLRGDWGPVVTLAAAAVVCGFFWELWNIHATPKWIYHIPWVNRFKLFEMPLVGYLGYVPFGPACWALWMLFTPSRFHE